MSDLRGEFQRNDRGSVMVVAALALVALVLFAALALDVGFMWSSRTQSQNVSDAVALAAAQKMIKQEGTNAATVEEGDARDEGQTYALKNSTVANPSVTVEDKDFTFGTWNLDTRKLEVPEDPTDPSQITGVRVDVRMDGATNKRSPGLLSRILESSDGSRPYADGFEVNNTAVAYLGFESNFVKNGIDVPVALDACELTDPDPDGGKCGKNFCKVTQEDAKCTLERKEGGTLKPKGVICGEFSNTGDQNMCFTNLRTDSSSVNAADLKKMLQDGSGNPNNLKAGDSIYIDNGEKASVLAEFRDKFYGCGSKYKKPAGTFTDDLGKEQSSRYGSGFPDSWVVKMPVVTCQDETHCAKGPPAEILGGACFEVREVVSSSPGGKGCPEPDNKKLILKGEWIKGRVLCPNNKTDETVRKLYDKYCRTPDDKPVETGGCDYGERANKVVIVE